MSRICGQFSTGMNFFVGQMLDYMSTPLTDGHILRGDGFEMGCASAARPSYYSQDGLAIVFDGFVYNQSDFDPVPSDVQKLAISYREIGFERTLQKINGDFAMALFDSKRGRLFLARDRFGIKPLYYASSSNFFAFASRPGALLQIKSISSGPRKKFVALFAAGHYRTFDNDPDKSPYEHISQLPAASYMLVESGRIQNIRRYWTLLDLPEYRDKENVLADRYRELIFDSADIRLKASEKPAFTLSGGMDSSTVIASAVQCSRTKRHAYSSVYSDRTYDETKEISSMFDTAVDEWHPVRVDVPDIFSLVQKMVRVNDEPVATATWLSHFILCQQVAKDGFKSLFGGLGGDELNAGEYEYYFYHFADLRSTKKENELRHEVQLWQKYHDHPIYKKNWDVMEKALSTMADISTPGKCLHDPVRMTRYFSALNPEYYDITGFEPVMETPFRSYLKNRAYQDITRETAPCCLRAEDRQTAAFDLENFLPFFDHRLVEFMFRVSGSLKIRDGITKVLLREAMKGILPEETRTRIKKTGWNAPAHIWFAHENKDGLMDLIHSRRFRDRGIYNTKIVENIVKDHFEIVTSGKPAENHMMFLWQLVNLNAWFEEFVETKTT